MRVHVDCRRRTNNGNRTHLLAPSTIHILRAAEGLRQLAVLKALWFSIFEVRRAASDETYLMRFYRIMKLFVSFLSLSSSAIETTTTATKTIQANEMDEVNERRSQPKLISYWNRIIARPQNPSLIE